MPAEFLAAISQFGAAGLIGTLWILERRHASVRDRQLAEAHRHLIETDRDRAILLDVVKENTRAIAALEASQRRLIDVLKVANARTAVS